MTRARFVLLALGIVVVGLSIGTIIREAWADTPTSAVSERPVAVGPDGSALLLPETRQPEPGGDAILGVRPDVPAWGWAIIAGAALLAGMCVVFYWLAGDDDSGRLGP